MECLSSTNCYKSENLCFDDRFSEESSWTEYLVENDDELQSSFCLCSATGSSSVFSDNVVPCRRVNNGKGDIYGTLSVHRSKGRRTLGSRKQDEDLEDTATSPVHTHIYLQEKGHNKQQVTGEGNLGCDKGKDMKYGSELRRKGMCLVSVSMLFNYFS